MQDIELAERRSTRADVFHGRLVFVAPGVGKGGPVERIAERLENNLRFARNAGAEINQRAKNVEEQRLLRSLWTLHALRFEHLGGGRA